MPCCCHCNVETCYCVEAGNDFYENKTVHAIKLKLCMWLILNSRDDVAIGSDGVGVVTFSQSQNCDCVLPALIVQIQH